MSNRITVATRALLLASAATLVSLPGAALAAQDQQPAEEPPAAAEAAAEPADDTVETGEIVVTARRRNEALLDVPIAVTAYTGEQLEREGAIDITDVGDTTPNVTLEVSRGTNSTLTAFIRGIGQQDPVPGFEQGVGLYLDDVYLNRPQGSVLDIYDVERIEILRGPQGTLYGRNTIGGAVKYVTRRLTDEPEVRVRATIGNYGQLDGVATLSYPIADIFRIGGSVARLTRDGFGKNFTTGQENYNKDVFAGRVSAEIGRDDSALLRLSADYTHDMSNTRGGHRLIPGQLTGAPILDDVFDSQGGLLDPKQDVKNKGAAANGQVEVADGFTLKSITAWRKDKSATPIDFDALPAADLDVPAIYKNKQFSQEVQLEIDRGPLAGVVGAYYLDANANVEFDARIYTILNGLAANSKADVDTKTWAVFGDLTYDISDQFSVALGGRYTSDKRHATVLRRTLAGFGSPTFGGLGIPFPNLAMYITSDFEGRRKDTAFTPRASISFKPNDDHHIYLSWSKGFKGGGFDPRGQSTRAPNIDGIPGPPSDEEIYEYMAFKPEKVTSYELGWKGSLLDKRVFASVALFNANYKDMQIPASVGCVINNLPNFCGETSNAGKARIRGVEFEGNARLFGDPRGSRATFSWSLGYLDAKFKKFLTTVAFDESGTPLPADPPTVVDMADNYKIQNTPKWTASGTLAYTTPLADGELNLSTTLSYRSKSQQFEIPSPMLDQGGFTLWDASAVYELPGDHWTVGLHGRNLANTKYIVAGYNFLLANPFTGEYFRTPAGGYIPQAGLGREGVLTAYYGNPRQIMFTVGYKL